MLQDLSFYADTAREMIRNDDARDKLYTKIDEACRSQFEVPDELRALPWIKDRKFVSTAPADAINAAVRTFAARNPQVEIQPLSDNPQEYDRTEQAEELMKWEFLRMNRIGRKSAHWQVVESAMKYCAVALETSYASWLYQGKTDMRSKQILRNSNFCWYVHHPGSVHSQHTNDILERVVNHTVMTGKQLLDKYGADNPGIQEMLRTVDKKDGAALHKTYYSLYDYTDWDARCIWIAENGGATYINRDAPTGITLLLEERTVPFIPWVIVDNEEPLLRQMLDAGLWDNVNILRTMQYSKAVDMAAHPEYWIQTPDGTLRGVAIDNTNPNQPLVTGPGVQVQKLVPPQLDPQLSTMKSEAESEVFRTTVAQILASVEKYAGTQNFSVVNAMLNAAIAQLSLAQMAAERAETMAMMQHFMWIDATEVPMVGFRDMTKSDSKKRGQEISIKKGDFDLQYLYVQVKLNPATVMDKQTEINNAINKVERLGMSKRMAWDELHLENYELSEMQRAEEIMYEAHAQAKSQEIVAKSQMNVQMQAQAAQAMMQQGVQSQFAGQQGMDTRGGGAPATMPGQGREQLTGQSASGQEIA